MYTTYNVEADETTRNDMVKKNENVRDILLHQKELINKISDVVAIINTFLEGGGDPRSGSCPDLIACDSLFSEIRAQRADIEDILRRVVHISEILGV